MNREMITVINYRYFLIKQIKHLCVDFITFVINYNIADDYDFVAEIRI